MIKVTHLHALEILDSRGRPTVAATMRLADGSAATVSIPSGASTGKAEAKELRDDLPPYGGLGCRKAVDNILRPDRRSCCRPRVLEPGRSGPEPERRSMERQTNHAWARTPSWPPLWLLPGRRQPIKALNSTTISRRFYRKAPLPSRGFRSIFSVEENTPSARSRFRTFCLFRRRIVGCRKSGRHLRCLPGGGGNHRETIQCESPHRGRRRIGSPVSNQHRNVGDELRNRSNLRDTNWEVTSSLAIDVAASHFVQEDGSYRIDDRNLSPEELIDLLGTLERTVSTGQY